MGDRAEKLSSIVELSNGVDERQWVELRSQGIPSICFS